MRLIHGLTSTYVVGLAGDCRGGWRCEERDQIRDLFGLDDPLDRHAAERAFAELLERHIAGGGAGAHPLLGHLGVDPSRTDRVYSDLLRRQFQRERALE